MHKDELARQEFEAVLAIAPDDVLCHYYLSLLYRRAGKTSEAAEQALLYEEKRDDDGAGARSLDFLRAHLEIRGESVPAHVHGNSDPNLRPDSSNKPNFK
jgi:hypothetical protein